MYRLISNGNVIGDYEKVVFTKKNQSNGCFVECSQGEADGVVAGGKVYAITNSDDYKDYEQVALLQLDGEVERSAELDYIRAMSGLV
jgi:hypothetical protein